MNTIKLFILILFIILLFYTIPLNNSKLSSSYIPQDNSTINNTNIGFVKPEHRLLKIFNTISSGSKIKLEGICTKYSYTKNTITKELNDKLLLIIKDLINTINQISHNDYYIKTIENVYILVSCNKNQRLFLDFFIYDIKNFYTIRLISDIVIIDNEIYINYLNIQTGSNSTILNNYDIKFNDTGILFDGNMFKENINNLFDSFYKQSFNVIGVSKTSLDYTNNDLTSVISMNSIKNMYFPSSISNDTINEFKTKDLSGYMEMYLPQNQLNIQSPMFCNKYKIEWDKYGILNNNNNNDKNCYINNNSTTTIYNNPINPPGLMNNDRTDITHYDWLLDKKNISNSL